jgi:hypothetical protein
VTDASSIMGAADQWMRLWAPWISLAPQELSQSINPGWIFGSVVVNQRNSSAPATEQAILAEESYGRQIGKLLEAVHELTKGKPGSATNPAFQDIAALREKVERLKREAASTRIDQLRRDLQLLKASDTAAFEKKVAALRALLPDDGKHGS